MGQDAEKRRSHFGSRNFGSSHFGSRLRRWLKWHSRGSYSWPRAPTRVGTTSFPVDAWTFIGHCTDDWDLLSVLPVERSAILALNGELLRLRWQWHEDSELLQLQAQQEVEDRVVAAADVEWWLDHNPAFSDSD